MPILIECGQLVDGSGRPPLRNARVLVDGDRIAAVGPAAQVPAPEGAEVVDLRDSTVLPGLIDCHTHLMLGLGEDPNAQYPQTELYQMLKCVPHLRTDIRAGITTIRNPSERSFRAAAVRHAVNQGLIPGPRIYAGMRGIRATHGWGQNAYGFDGAEALRRAIRENVEAGADLIKIYTTGENYPNTALRAYFTRDEIQTCVDEAHRAGIRITAHAHGGQGLRDALEAGVDSIEHGTRITEDDVELFLKRGATLVTTFNPYFHPATRGPAPPQYPEYEAGMGDARANVERLFPQALRSGMKFAVGSDSRHGHFIFELEMLVELGLRPLEAISACTRQAAETIGIGDRAGTLEAGKWADLIAVREDPTEDIARLRAVHFVMKGGARQDLSPL
jgi:imidazolonepropionase-like amidohydrolase